MPNRRVGSCFVHALATKLTGVRKCRWNAERFVIFQTVILQCAWHTTKLYEIQKWIDRRLDAWEAGDHEMLVGDTARTCAQYLSTRKGEDSLKNRAKIYHSLVLRVKLRSAVIWATNRQKGGVFHPGDTCPRTGQPVL